MIDNIKLKFNLKPGTYRVKQTLHVNDPRLAEILRAAWTPEAPK